MKISIGCVTRKRKRGELIIFHVSFLVLSPCLHMMPMQRAPRKKPPGSDKGFEDSKDHLIFLYL